MTVLVCNKFENLLYIEDNVIENDDLYDLSVHYKREVVGTKKIFPENAV